MNIFWGGSSSVVKAALLSIDPLSLVFWRFLLAAVVLFVVFLSNKPSFKFTKKDLIRVIFCGLFLAGSNFAWMTGIKLSFASDASLLYVFEPLSAILMAGIFLKEKLRKTIFVGLAFAVTGYVWLSGFDALAKTFSSEGVGLGNFLVVLGLLCDATFSVVMKPLGKGTSSVAAASIAVLVAFISMAIPAAFTGLELPRTGPSIFAVSYLALVCTVVGFTLWIFVMKKIPLNVMLFTVFVQPIVGPIIANVFLGEKIDERLIVGGIFLLTGTFIAIWGHFRAHREDGRVLQDDLITPTNL